MLFTNVIHAGEENASLGPSRKQRVSYSPHCYDKIPWKCNLRKGLFLAHLLRTQYIMVGTEWQQEQEAATYIHPSMKKQKERNTAAPIAFSFPSLRFYSAHNPHPWRGIAHTQGNLPSSAKSLQKCAHRHLHPAS